MRAIGDAEAFVDTALAQTRTTLSGIRTALGLQSFVEEVVARHVHWVVLQELAGTPGSIAVLQLGAGNLAAAAHFYFFDRRGTWDVNDYGQQLFAQGDAVKFAQLAAFLRRCAAQSFSTDFDGQCVDPGISGRGPVLRRPSQQSHRAASFRRLLPTAARFRLGRLRPS